MGKKYIFLLGANIPCRRLPLILALISLIESAYISTQSSCCRKQLCSFLGSLVLESLSYCSEVATYQASSNFSDEGIDENKDNDT